MVKVMTYIDTDTSVKGQFHPIKSLLEYLT